MNKISDEYLKEIASQIKEFPDPCHWSIGVLKSPNPEITGEFNYRFRFIDLNAAAILFDDEPYIGFCNSNNAVQMFSNDSIFGGIITTNYDDVERFVEIFNSGEYHEFEYGICDYEIEVSF